MVTRNCKCHLKEKTIFPILQSFVNVIRSLQQLLHMEPYSLGSQAKRRDSETFVAVSETREFSSVETTKPGGLSHFKILSMFYELFTQSH